jgi:hypothetical protein
VSPEYRAALLASRRQMGALDLDTARTIARAVAQWADELARWLALRPDDPRRTSVAASREVIYRSALAMDQRIREAAAANRSVLFDDVLAMWQQAGLDVAARKDIPNALLGAVRSPPMTLLDAWANRPGAANWQTLIQGHVANAAQEADAIVGAAIRNGASMQDLARNLQRYVKGSEAFQDAFKAVKRADGSEVWRLDRGAITPELRGAATEMRRNATRIAVTEIHSARGEAEYLHFVADPLIYAVKWSLAPDRGTQEGKPDICDVLATVDAYGMGPGVFPLDRVPPIPHPEDRCERDPLERSVKHAGAAKPMPPRILAVGDIAIPRADLHTDRGQERIREAWADLMAFTDAGAPAARQAMSQAHASGAGQRLAGMVR